MSINCGRGGIADQLRIKVGNMVPACCERNPSGSTADTLFYKRLSLTSSSAAVRQYTRQREENE